MSEPLIHPCSVCGWEFYGYAYMGEVCSAECNAASKIEIEVSNE